MFVKAVSMLVVVVRVLPEIASNRFDDNVLSKIG